MSKIKDNVLIEIKRPEGYEDVAPDIVIEDFLENPKEFEIASPIKDIPEIRIITEAIQIILRDKDIDRFEAGLLRFHQKSIRDILEKIERPDTEDVNVS